MAEVAKQIGPLSKQVDKLGSNLDRLFNTNGGPEGFLQSARREDNTRFQTEKDINDGRFDMIFAMFQEFKDDLKPLKQFMGEHLAKEQQKAVDDGVKEAALAARVEDSERRFKRWLALATLVLGLLTFVMNLRGCSQMKAFFSPDQVNHSLNMPQISTK